MFTIRVCTGEHGGRQGECHFGDMNKSYSFSVFAKIEKNKLENKEMETTGQKKQENYSITP